MPTDKTNEFSVRDVRLYLLRHGETEWAKTGQHTGKTDIPLTDVGRQQAQQLAPHLAKIDFAAVYVSPLSRARDTAALAGLTKNVHVEQRLIEFDYGAYEGRTSEDIHKTIPDWTIWSGPCPGGESLRGVANRCKDFLSSINAVSGNIALVSHGHLLRILTSVWLGCDPTFGKHILLDPARVSILRFDRGIPAVDIWNSQPLI